jgi:outer membrane protein assembly factor BamB
MKKPRRELVPRKVLAIVCSLLALGACSVPGRVHAPTRAARPATRNAPHHRAADPQWSIDMAAPGAVSADRHGAVVLDGNDVVALTTGGRRQWRVTVDDLGIQYPALDDDLVVVSTVVDAGGATTGAFVVLDRSTGAERWRVDVDDEPGPVTLTRETVFAATTAGDVLALTRAGNTRWKHHLPGGISSRGSLAYDATTGTVATVVFSAREGWWLWLLEAATGANAGGLDLGDTEPPSAVVTAGPARLVMGDGESHHLMTVDLRRRVVAQAVPTGGSFDPANQPAAGSDLAVVIDDTGTVTAMDLRTGGRRWQRALGGGVLDARVLLTRDAVVVATFLGGVTVLSRSDGRPIRSPVTAASGVAVGYAVAGRTLVVSRRFGATHGIEGWPAL